MQGLSPEVHEHEPISLNSGQGVAFHLNAPANVMLLTEDNFRSYLRGHLYKFYGGLARNSPFVVYPTRPGNYHVVVVPRVRHGRLEYSKSIVDR